jgi:hypothetical protein
MTWWVIFYKAIARRKVPTIQEQFSQSLSDDGKNARRTGVTSWMTRTIEEEKISSSSEVKEDCRNC